MMLLVLCCVVSCNRGSQKVMSKYQPGQVWTYRTRPGEEASRLTILKVEPYGKTGNAVHVRINGVKINNPQVVGGVSTEIGHLPFAEAVIDKCVVKLESSGAAVSHRLEGYDTWKEQADKGKAGVFTVTVVEAIGIVEKAMSQQAP